MSPLTNGSYERFLVTYHLTEQDKHTLKAGGLVNTEGKTEIDYLEDSQTPTDQTSNAQDCKWEDVTIWVPYGADLHTGDDPCNDPVKSYSITVAVLKCTNISDPNQPGNGGGPTSGDTGGDGGGDGESPPTDPCNDNDPDIPTGPQSPNTGFRKPCVGVPTIANYEVVEESGLNNPCQKTKTLMANQNMQTSITQLKTNATSGSGEQGFKASKTGEPSPIIQGGAHNVDFGDKTGYAGGYHNHTGIGIPMLSPPDINQLLGFARAQGNNGDPTLAFVGMVAPNGMHYIIRFEGTYQDSTNLSLSKEVLDKLMDDYRKTQKILLENSQYANTSGIGLNARGLEKLFFETLANMNIDKSKITLQRVDGDGIKTINLNSDGTTTPVPCS